MNKYIIGSTLLGLSNNRDNDYLYLVDSEEEYNTVRFENGEDKHIRTTAEIIKCMNFETDVNIWRKLINYQLDKEIIGQNFPIEYHILNHKEEAKNLLKSIVKNKDMNFNKNITSGNNCCTKDIYHIAYNLFILQNNSPIITDDQKAIIQQIHDIQMPISYLDELATAINLL